MPEFLPPSLATLRLVNGEPVIDLAVRPVHNPAGWRLVNKATLLVVDGPGDEGFLLPRMGIGVDGVSSEGWDAAVQQRGGAWVDTGDGGPRFFANLMP